MNIKQKLIALFLFIGLIPTLAVSLVAYVTISNELRATTANQLNSIAIKQEQKINSLLQKKQEEVIKLTNNFNLQVALGDYLTTKSAKDRATIDQILQTKQTEVSEIQAIYIADTQDKIVASTLKAAEGQKLSSQDVAAPDESETVITVREDPRDGINKLYITTDVTVNKKEAAVMSVVFRVDDIVAAVQDYTGLGSTGETIVASKSGSEIVSLFPLRFDTDAALSTKLNSLDLFSGDNTNYRQAKDYRGHDVLVASRSVGFADWVIATKMDRQEALNTINQLRNGLISIVIISSIAIVAIALYFARFFTNPILRIARTSQQIGQGDFAAHIDLNRSDEIGDLGASINAMGQNLKQLVSSIETQRTQLEVILNSTAESILAIDKNGNILIANRAASELTSQPVDSLIGKNIADTLRWKRAGSDVHIDYSVSEARIFPDIQYTDAAGNDHFVKVIVAPVSGDQEQTTAHAIVTVHDETKSRELEDMKIDFVSMAAHELRTPLAAIKGYLELISYKQKGTPAEPATAGYIHQALKSSTELGGLINNLLDVTRIERGTLTLNMEKTDLAACIAGGVKDAGFVAKDKNITITYDGPVSNCFVVGDHIALREVINNLLTNAIKYTEANGKVHVALDLEQNKYVVRVSDTGIGIPAKALPNLFTKFYRVHGGLDSGSTGTGLGLFISKSIIERHHGTITVNSEVGKGSTFTFTVPILDETHLAAVQSEQQSQQTLTRRHRGWVTKNITR